MPNHTVIMKNHMHILLLFILVFAGSTKDTFAQLKYKRDTTLVTTLLDSSAIDKKGKKIILTETDSFIVYTSLENFSRYFYGYHKEKQNKNSSDYDSTTYLMFKTIEKSSEKTIKAYKIAKEINLDVGIYIYSISEILDHGKCLVYDKIHKKLEKQILIKWTGLSFPKNVTANGPIVQSFYVSGHKIYAINEGWW